MPSVRLDSAILGSSLWIDKPARDLYITALLMARPTEPTAPIVGLDPFSIGPSGFVVPPGRYGLVEATGAVITFTAGLTQKDGEGALQRLCEPAFDHPDQTHEGRRLVRVHGGFIVLDYEGHQPGDRSAADRQRRWRENQKKSIKQPVKPEKKKPATKSPSRQMLAMSDDFAIFWEAYPRKTAKTTAWKSWQKLNPDPALVDVIVAAVEAHKKTSQWLKDDGQFIPHPATWLNQRRWEDKITTLTKTSDEVQGSWKTGAQEEPPPPTQDDDDVPFNDLD